MANAVAITSRPGEAGPSGRPRCFGAGAAAPANDPARPKVVFVCDRLTFGGSQQLIARLCHGCRAAGWLVEILTGTSAGGPEDARSAWFAGAADAITALPLNDRVGRLAVLTAPDVVAVSYAQASVSAYIAADVAAIRRDIRQTLFLFNRFDAASVPLIAPALDMIIAESLDVIAHVPGGVASRLIPSFVPPLPLNPPREAGRPLHVGFIGRMSPGKNPLSVAFMALRLPKKGFRFTMVGGGPLGKAVSRRVGLTRLLRDICYLGHVTDDVLERVWQELDVLVLPSDFEGRPLVLQVAQWRGVAVVASHVGGIPEIVTHDETGLLCAPGDVTGVVAQLARLAAEPGLLDRLVGAARARAEQDETIPARLGRYLAAITGSEGEDPALDPPRDPAPQGPRRWGSL